MGHISHGELLNNWRVPSSKLTQTLPVIGVGRLVSIKKMGFSGSMFIYQRVYRNRKKKHPRHMIISSTQY